MNDLLSMLDRAEAAAKARGMTLEELWARFDVHRATWNRWKAGTTEPRFKYVRAIQLFIAESELTGAARAPGAAA